MWLQRGLRRHRGSRDASSPQGVRTDRAQTDTKLTGPSFIPVLQTFLFAFNLTPKDADVSVHMCTSWAQAHTYSFSLLSLSLSLTHTHARARTDDSNDEEEKEEERRKQETLAALDAPQVQIDMQQIF